MQVALSYTSLSHSSAHIDKRITSADRMDTRRDDGKKETPGYTAGRDHRLVRMEFIELCIDVLWDVPFEQLRAAAANHQAAVKAVREEMLQRWKRAADRVDVFARTYIVPAYITCVFFMLNLNLDDSKYSWSAANTSSTIEDHTEECLPPRSADTNGVCRYWELEQYQGIWRAYMTPFGVWSSLIAPILIVVFGVVYLSLYRIAVQKRIVQPRKKDVAATNRRSATEMFNSTSGPDGIVIVTKADAESSAQRRSPVPVKTHPKPTHPDTDKVKTQPSPSPPDEAVREAPAARPVDLTTARQGRQPEAVPPAPAPASPPGPLPAPAPGASAWA